MPEEVASAVDQDAHDEYWAKLRDPEFKESFEKKYRANKSGCFIWLASKDKDGYGQVSVGVLKGRIKRAHRVAYEMYTGEEIPEGMEIDHTCHIRRCVNIEHFEIVTRQDNMKNLRVTEDWAVSEDEFQRKKTTPEKLLIEVKEIIERSGVRQPPMSGRGEHGYSLATIEGTPWRDIAIEDGYIPQDRFSLVKLFLDCVRMGVQVESAAAEILGVSPWTVQSWTTKNETWRFEMADAKKAGRKYRYDTIEEKHLDELERKIDFAEFKDVANSLSKLREQDEDRIAIKKNSEPGNNMPAITIIFGSGNPEKVLRSLVEMGEEIEAEFEVVKPKELPEGN